MLPFRLSLGRPFNRLSHQLVLRLTRTAWLGEINAWRRTDLNLLPLSWLSPMPGSPSRSIPHVYGISQHVLPRPTDWPANHHLSGFWFTPPPDHYQPPPDLLRFLDAGEPPVYIGFGSMAQTDQTITDLLEACRTSGRRIVAGLLPSAIAAHLPENLFLVQDIPHAWLFPHMQAAIHHGGAGTTAASLRAGLPTAIAPVGIDQFFWGERVWRLGAGPKPTPQRILNAVRIAELVEDVASPAYRAHSARLGALLGAEDGVAQAAALIKAAVL
jgi:sterol 3beta-glucosyltransferase